MKLANLKPEHFANGAGFNQADFDAYIAASDQYAKHFGVKYLSCVAGGILLSFLFSGAGGFTGNMLAVAVIFAGLILGALINAPALKAVNKAAKKLGVTKADVKEAMRHLKDGTVAWQGESGSTPMHDDTHAAQDEASAARSRRAGPKTDFARAVKLMYFTVPIWLAGTLLFLFRPYGFMVSLSALFNIAYAVLAAGVCLMCFARGRQRNAGVAAVVMSFVMRMALGIALIYVYSDRRIDAVAAQLVSTVIRPLVSTGAVVIGALIGKRGSRAGARARAGCMAAGAFVAYGIINGIVSGGDAATFMTALFDALVFAGLYFLTGSLCDGKKPAIRLRGMGLVWCWLAVIGAAAAIVFSIVQPLRTDAAADVFQIIMSGVMLAGYILLLRNRRIGLHFILCGAWIVMSAALHSSIEGLMHQTSQAAVLISSVLMLLNPLFAYLAVRAGETAASATAVRRSASPAVSAVRKAPTILNQYRAGLSYLDSCGAFDEAKFREFNRITGNRFSEADIRTQHDNARMMIKGMEEVRSALRSSMTEGISMFEKLEQNGIDLSNDCL